MSSILDTIDKIEVQPTLDDSGAGASFRRGAEAMRAAIKAALEEPQAAPEAAVAEAAVAEEPSEDDHKPKTYRRR